MTEIGNTEIDSVEQVDYDFLKRFYFDVARRRHVGVSNVSLASLNTLEIIRLVRSLYQQRNYKGMHHFHVKYTGWILRLNRYKQKLSQVAIRRKVLKGASDSLERICMYADELDRTIQDESLAIWSLHRNIDKVPRTYGPITRFYQDSISINYKSSIGPEKYIPGHN